MRRGLLFFLFLFALGRPCLPASDDDLTLQQYDHTTWTLRDGAPSQIFAIARTTDGFIWLGTANGLFRFGGVKFEAFQPRVGQRLIEPSVQSVLATPDGGLWIGYTFGGASFLKTGHLQDYEIRVNGRTGTVWYMAKDSDGSIWAACTVGLSHFFDNSWHGLDRSAGFSAPSAYRVFFDTDQTLWVVTDHHLFKKASGRAIFEDTLLNAGSNASFEQPSGGPVFINDEHGVLTLDELAKKLNARHNVIKDDSLVEIRLDERGSLWALSSKIGVKRLARVADSTSAAERAAGMTSDRASSSLVDPEGTVWIATAGGLDRFRPFALIPAPLPDNFGFYTIAVDCRWLAPDRNGERWSGPPEARQARKGGSGRHGQNNFNDARPRL